MSLSSELHIAAKDPAKSRFALESVEQGSAVAVSPLVAFHADRCIACGACEAFADEIVGAPLIRIEKDNDGRPVAVADATAPKAPYFSGNLAQVCPTNALTDIPNASRARPWDRQRAESTCMACSVGCRMAVQTTDERLTAADGIDDAARNKAWLCDRGRYGIEVQYSPARLREPLLRSPNELDEQELAPATWEQALARTAEVLDQSDPSRIGIIGGSRMTNDDQYAWVKFAKGLLGTDNVDAQTGDGLPPELLLGSPRATIDEACEADAVVLLVPDLRETVPVLYLRLRQAVIERGLQVIEITPTRTAFSGVAQHVLTYRTGEAATVINALLGRGTLGRDSAVESTETLAAASLVLAGASNVVVVAGRQSVAESSRPVAEAVGLLVQHARARLLSALPNPNLEGALVAGMAPGVLPGRVSLRSGSEWFLDAWGRVPGKQGLDTVAMLQAAQRGDIDVLILLECDVLREVPDRQLAAAALEAVPTVIALDSLATESVVAADIVLATPSFGERSGTTTNLEGSVSAIPQVLVSSRSIRTPQQIAVSLAALMGADIGCATSDQIEQERLLLMPAVLGTVVDGAPYPMLYSVAEPSPPVGVDAYALRLVATPRLFDRQAGVQRSENLASLATAERVRIHSSTLAPLGITHHGKVRLLNAQGSLVVPVVVDDTVPRGTAVAAINVPGSDIGMLIDLSRPVTNVRVETP